MNKKKDMRLALLAKRDTISASARSSRSKTLCCALEEYLVARLPDCATVAVYYAMKSEVDLACFIEKAYARGWRICFPCMIRNETKPQFGKTSPRMEFYFVADEQIAFARELFLEKPLRCLSCDTLERYEFMPVAPANLDAIVVPLVAFDNTGNRLGYGGGNYDRLLSAVRPDAVVVGAAFEEQRVAKVPTETHDKSLPHIILA